MGRSAIILAVAFAILLGPGFTLLVDELRARNVPDDWISAARSAVLMLGVAHVLALALELAPRLSAGRTDAPVRDEPRPTPVHVHAKPRLRMRRVRGAVRRPMAVTTLGVSLVLTSIVGYVALDSALQVAQPPVTGKVIGVQPGIGPNGINVLIPDSDGLGGHSIVYMQSDPGDTSRGAVVEVQRSVLRKDYATTRDHAEHRAQELVPPAIGLVAVTTLLALGLVGYRVDFVRDARPSVEALAVDRALAA